MFHLFHAGRHFFFATTVNDHSTFSSQTTGCTYRVHRRVTSADHCHFLTLQHGRIAFGIGSIHQIDTCKVFVGRHDADQVFARYVHEIRQTGTAGSKEAFETLFVQVFITNRLTDDTVRDELHAHLTKSFYLYVHNLVRQTEFRNTVFQYAANLMPRFDHRHIITAFRHITGKRQAGRTGTDHGYLDTVLFSNLRHRNLTALTFIVGSETFQITDGNRGLLHLQVDTFAFALFLLRTYTPTNGRQGTGFFQYLRCFEKFTPFDILDECRDIDTYRTTFHTGWIRTVQATLCLLHGLLFCQAQVHLFQAGMTAIFRIEFVHFHTGNIRAFFIFFALAQFFPPGFGTAGCN